MVPSTVCAPGHPTTGTIMAEPLAAAGGAPAQHGPPLADIGAGTSPCVQPPSGGGGNRLAIESNLDVNTRKSKKLLDSASTTEAADTITKKLDVISPQDTTKAPNNEVSSRPLASQVEGPLNGCSRRAQERMGASASVTSTTKATVESIDIEIDSKAEEDKTIDIENDSKAEEDKTTTSNDDSGASRITAPSHKARAVDRKGSLPNFLAAVAKLRAKYKCALTKAVHERHEFEGTVAQQDAELMCSLSKEMQDHEKHVTTTNSTAPRLPSRLHRDHSRSLLNAARLRRESLLTIQTLIDKINDTHSAITMLQHQGQEQDTVQPIENPHCQASGAFQRQLERTQATDDDSGVRDDVLYVRLDADRHESPQDAPEPFFSITARATTGERRYQAAAADIMLQSAGGTRVLAKGSVVDTGAARCALDLAYAKSNLPDLSIRPTRRSFTDASGNIMDIVGEADLAFWVGDLLLWTTVYVFRNLGHHFLLGINAIEANGLTVSSTRKILYSERPEATDASQVPLTMAVCNVCETTSRPLPSIDAPHGACGCRSVMVTLCKDNMCLKANARHGHTTQRLPCYAVTDTPVNPAAPEPNREQAVEVRVAHPGKIQPGETAVLSLEYGALCKGEETTAEVEIDPLFIANYPTLKVAQTTYHSTLTRHVNLRVKNVGKTIVRLRAPTLVGKATYHRLRPRKRSSSPPHELMTLVEEGSMPEVHSFKVLKADRATGAHWKCLGSEIPGQDVQFSDGMHRLHHYRLLHNAQFAARLPEQTTFSPEEWGKLAEGAQLLLNHCVLANDGQYYAPTTSLPFAEGGRPRSIEDLHEIGFSLQKAIDPSQPKRPDGTYPPLSDEMKAELYGVALEFWYVWSRDARAPELSRLVVIEIPTGQAQPIAQKPYPIPYAYLDAARDELQKLVDAGLIEPCISNWASPVLVRLKKDSTPDKIRLKLICDFRRLNEVTVPDAAGLGDQEEILDGFGGDQRWAGICDAAGGFYQLLIHPKDRAKTAICLPTSMGGTQFMWRVAPYGLTRNPSGYSRGMMFALKGLNHCVLDGGRAHGGTGSWIDDISLHANSFQGFKDLFRKILARLAFAGMSLKATKCLLLHQFLEVLGFYVTPDGIVVQPEAIERIERCGKGDKVVGPSNVKEIRTFLGAVQFYRRFVPRIALLAAPMNELLKQPAPNDKRFIEGTPEHQQAWAAVQQSFEAIMLFLRSSAVVSAPDLSDPAAEYVIVCDACDIAAGGALLQWQHPSGRGPGPPAGVPLRGGTGPDPLIQSWRLDCGWKLRTIGYFHKTFNPAQINYPTFDQEGVAVLTCCRRWAKLITGRPTTIYTDSSVAATMLSKHHSTQRLARWGIELGTFMPYLKIQHRRGTQNGLADFISRYPTFERYVKRSRDELQLPNGPFETLTTVPLFTHEVASEAPTREAKRWIAGEAERELLKSWSVELVETPKPSEAEAFWQQPDNVALVEEKLSHCADPDSIMDCLFNLKEAVSKEHFWAEQHEFDEYTHQWDIYSDIFQSTTGRKPVLWDLCCGEGGYSRGAQCSGFDCYGFDKDASCKYRYENEPTAPDGYTLSGMTFTQADVLQPEFWTQLAAGGTGEYAHIPAPDVIHVSPACSPYSRLTRVDGTDSDRDTWTINFLIKQLKEHERRRAAEEGQHVLWQIENVPESRGYVTESVDTQLLLCGTMMGHETFRHRVFYCNYPANSNSNCRHEGKYVGSRGVRFNEHYNNERFSHLPPPNMYGVYSRPYSARGSADDWHGALGHCPGTFSEKGLRGALPVGYGRLLGGQSIAHLLNRRFACPVWPPGERQEHENAALEMWACHGYQPLSQLNYLGLAEPEEDASLLESWEPDAAELMAFTIPGASLWAPSALGQPVNEGKSKTTAVSPPSVDYQELPEAAEVNPYVISAEDHRSDPEICRIKATLTANTKSTTWSVKDDILYRFGFDSTGEPIRQMYVPQRCRGPLMAQFHYSNHRGYRPLVAELSRSYYWPNMATDCTLFTATCEICAKLAAAPLNKVPTNPIPTPARPFTVLHVDHADFRGRTSGPLKYQYVLVVTCALTRFTLFIPTTTSTAEDTLKALNKHVFCIFGPPLVMVSDNGPAFVSALCDSCSKFWGYRHIHILPYNSQANGTAEASVKKIKLLLDRHCQGHNNWHTLVPVLQLRLNADHHSGLGMSPYVALFGREPVGLEQLEDPSLYPETGDGDGFIHELRGRMQAAHATLREFSDTLKKAHADEQNARIHARLDSAKHGVVEASDDKQARYAWLIHGSKAQAAYVAKHGHGLPWKHKYKVLEARPHAVRLEVPTDGSVPRVGTWQLRRRVAPAHESEHGPDESSPLITESGLLIPGHADVDTLDPLSGDPHAGDENAYKVEHVKYAEKVGRYYKIWLKWVDFDELGWRWAHELRRETTNAELLTEIEEAVNAERTRLNVTKRDAYAEHEDDDAGVEATPNSEPPLLGRGAPRERAAPARLIFHLSDVYALAEQLADAARYKVVRRLRAALDMCPWQSLVGAPLAI